MGEKNNPYFVVLMSCWSSWFHSREVSNKVASAANFIQTQCIVSSGVHFSLCNSSLLVYKCTLQVFKCTDEALRVSYELHCLLVHESTTTKVALALEQKASLSEAKLPSSTFATLMYMDFLASELWESFASQIFQRLVYFRLHSEALASCCISASVDTHLPPLPTLILWYRPGQHG